MGDLNNGGGSSCLLLALAKVGLTDGPGSVQSGNRRVT